ncbi:MAG TPA: alpha/beta fold hydrolase [Candidatus Eremiobacteraceae bacterium]|nr:alpha/beta fold hydrolase [Candidatus Eremiobacteraceae bacterium]
MSRRTLVFSLLAALAFVVPNPVRAADSYPSVQLRAESKLAHDTLIEHFSEIQARSHLGVALEERLDGDASGIDLNGKPAWMTLADYREHNSVLFRLNASLITQLATGKYHDLGAVRGADDTVYKSPVDGTMQPLAAYVPASYSPNAPTALVVFLHGRTWSENDVIATPTVRQIADATGTIVVAPYGRGDNQYADPASLDVYAALDAAERAFNVDRRRVYLAGHSMGGYGVFIVAPKHPEVWTAVFAASGGMVTDTLTPALKALQHTPVYLVVGSDDEIVPQGYMSQNATLLRQSGIETHYYEQPGGKHSIVTISRAFKQAWLDMLAHRVAAPAEETQLPHAPPATGKPN